MIEAPTASTTLTVSETVSSYDIDGRRYLANALQEMRDLSDKAKSEPGQFGVVTGIA
jgi:hypothetical protein